MSYSTQIAMALRLIKAKGTTAVLRHYPINGPLVRDRVKDTISDTGEATYPVDLVDLPGYINKRGSASTHAMEGLNQTLTRTVYIAGATCPVDPLDGDRIEGLEGKNWTIKGEVARYGPDGKAAILYRAMLSQ